MLDLQREGVVWEKEGAALPPAHQISAYAREMILDWTSNFGLLGVLHQEAMSMTILSWFAPPITIPGMHQQRFYADALCIRTGWKWQIASYLPRRTEGEEPSATDARPPERTPWIQRLHPVLVRQKLDPNWVVPLTVESYQESEDPLGDFFPALRLNAETDAPSVCSQFRIREGESVWLQYPLLTWEESWLYYGEPLDDWVRLAVFLARSLQDFSKHSEWHALERLQCILSSSRQSVEPAPGGGFRTRIVYPSLISMMAGMAVEDVTGGHRILRCANMKCNRFMVAGSYQSSYCSDQCKWRAAKSRQRARPGRTSDSPEVNDGEETRK